MLRTILFLLVVPLLFTSCSSSSAHSDSFKLMSFNVRYDNPDDGRHAWPNRKAHVVDIIKTYEASIIGVQEAEYHQLTYMDDQLDNHTWFGKGRTDGKKEGEFTAIFYNKTRFEMLEHKTFWCSKTPGEPSKDWDAAYPRTITRGLFNDSQTQNKFLVYNTHFDHISETARRECAKLLLQDIGETRKNDEKLSVVVTGDFNATPDSKPYKILTGQADIDISIHLADTKDLSQTPPKGPEGTFTGFNRDNVGDAPIDYIFANGDITVHSHTTIDDIYDGILPSDHYPVSVEVSLNYE